MSLCRCPCSNAVDQMMVPARNTLGCQTSSDPHPLGTTQVIQPISAVSSANLTAWGEPVKGMDCFTCVVTERLCARSWVSAVPIILFRVQI